MGMKGLEMASALNTEYETAVRKRKHGNALPLGMGMILAPYRKSPTPNTPRSRATFMEHEHPVHPASSTAQ